jgi:hypothetical protein
MDVLIQCPFCNRALLRDIRDILTVSTFYCECTGRGFKVKFYISVIPDEDQDIGCGCEETDTA